MPSRFCLNQSQQNMTYETFFKLAMALEKYIKEHSSIMCSPSKIHKHLLSDISYAQAQNVTQHYRLYIKNRYSLNKLILMIILYKYTNDNVFENSLGEMQKTKTLPMKRHCLKYEIEALNKFMHSY